MNPEFPYQFPAPLPTGSCWGYVVRRKKWQNKVIFNVKIKGNKTDKRQTIKKKTSKNSSAYFLLATNDKVIDTVLTRYQMPENGRFRPIFIFLNTWNKVMMSTGICAC